MLFGERLQHNRNKLHLTQQDIAIKMHVSRQTISSWERGNSYPDIDSLIKLSDYYRVSLDILLKEDTGMKEYLEKDLVRKKLKKITTASAILDLIITAMMLLWIAGLFKPFATIFFIVVSTINIGLLSKLQEFSADLKDSNEKPTKKEKTKTAFYLSLVAILFLVYVFFALDLSTGTKIATSIIILLIFCGGYFDKYYWQPKREQKKQLNTKNQI
ncbi:helix-turn-helix domain-containing protein [Ligilactobacillus acidipiscis]|uniref:helix-turn-helix domain-containing protein n=1 Tax=Ligilactobacillus acidipiscis TaxID=89059 RepID=UPI0023F81F9E|nr:helix-turn-helix transcriptional regulator [Ligilactobacillus acidipiscis]WEV58177.1 helix-turn-helix transcriptional regulator [Ligilactobacillus acidipiscis]